jgi:hypothetical protein
VEGRPPGDPFEPTAPAPPGAAGLEPEDYKPEDAPPPEGARGFIPETVKKALLAGVGALFMTEEGARRLARDWKLPKEVIGFIGQQAAGAKDEILRVLADEIRRFLESEAVRREFWKALSAAAVEVKAEIRLVPAEGGGEPRPEVKATVRPRRASKPARASKRKKK